MRQAGEGGNGALVRADNGIIRFGHRAEACFFELLILLRFSVGAVSIKVHQYKILQQYRNLGPREHIGLHPMTIRAGIASEVDEHQLIFRAGLGERFFILIFHPHGRCGFAAPAEQSGLFGLHRDERLHVAERCAEQSGQQADRECKEQCGHQDAADAQTIVRLDSFEPQEAEEIETRQREEDDPRRQEHFARDPIGLQDLIGRA